MQMLPQLDFDFYFSQIIWSVLVFYILYCLVKNFVIPKMSISVTKRQQLQKNLSQEIERQNSNIKWLRNEINIIDDKAQKKAAHMIANTKNIIDIEVKQATLIIAKKYSEDVQKIQEININDFVIAQHDIENVSHAITQALSSEQKSKSI